MCNITKKTKKKTVTVYKAVYKLGKYYYSCFAGTRITVGKVKPQTEKDYNKISNITDSANFFETYDQNWNNQMVGKTSGFAKKSNAVKLSPCYSNRCVIKIQLGGEIWQGDAYNISSNIPYDEITYAGTEILSFEKIK
jgi:hypothetical protein